jgi:hypothetical protein
MRRVTEVLVSVEHADGAAAIVRDGRGMWLAGRADQPSVLIDDARPRIEGLAGDRTAQGGRLPPGAVGAEVVDHAGARHPAAAANGAWIVVLDEPVNGDTNPVRYVDAAGATVTAPLPAGARTPIDDAPEPCPACGASGWDHVVPDDHPGGMTHVVCRACGHAEGAMDFRPPLRQGDEPPWPEEENLPEGEAPLPPVDLDPGEWTHTVVADAGFPVYAVPGRLAEVQGRGSGSTGATPSRSGTPTRRR